MQRSHFVSVAVITHIIIRQYSIAPVFVVKTLEGQFAQRFLYVGVVLVEVRVFYVFAYAAFGLGKAVFANEQVAFDAVLGVEQYVITENAYHVVTRRRRYYLSKDLVFVFECFDDV